MLTRDRFCSLANCADGSFPRAGLIADDNGNLFGTTANGGANVGISLGDDTVFEIVKTASGYASTATILVRFNAIPDGALPEAGRIADGNGNLFGTTSNAGLNAAGTVFEITKTASGYASAPNRPGELQRRQWRASECRPDH